MKWGPSASHSSFLSMLAYATELALQAPSCSVCSASMLQHFLNKKKKILLLPWPMTVAGEVGQSILTPAVSRENKVLLPVRLSRQPWH